MRARYKQPFEGKYFSNTYLFSLVSSSKCPSWLCIVLSSLPPLVFSSFSSSEPPFQTWYRRMILWLLQSFLVPFFGSRSPQTFNKRRIIGHSRKKQETFVFIFQVGGFSHLAIKLAWSECWIFCLFSIDYCCISLIQVDENLSDGFMTCTLCTCCGKVTKLVQYNWMLMETCKSLVCVFLFEWALVILGTE